MHPHIESKSKEANKASHKMKEAAHDYMNRWFLNSKHSDNLNSQRNYQ